MVINGGLLWFMMVYDGLLWFIIVYGLLFIMMDNLGL
jgi:hypothetical protein